MIKTYKASLMLKRTAIIDAALLKCGINYYTIFKLEVSGRYFRMTDIPLLEGLVYD